MKASVYGTCAAQGAQQLTPTSMPCVSMRRGHADQLQLPDAMTLQVAAMAASASMRTAPTLGRAEKRTAGYRLECGQGLSAQCVCKGGTTTLTWADATGA